MTLCYEKLAKLAFKRCEHLRIIDYMISINGSYGLNSDFYQDKPFCNLFNDKETHESKCEYSMCD